MQTTLIYILIGTNLALVFVLAYFAIRHNLSMNAYKTETRFKDMRFNEILENIRSVPNDFRALQEENQERTHQLEMKIIEIANQVKDLRSKYYNK